MMEGEGVRAVSSHGHIDVVCILCGKADKVSSEEFSNEYEELRHHQIVHHICASCQEKIRSDAFHNHDESAT